MRNLEQEFTNPPRCWKSRPLWFWNGPLDKAHTAQIMVASKADGYGGLAILPVQGMDVTFMSQAYLDHYRHALDKASELELKMCLYDEFWFPSGQAGGLLAERHPEALAKRLDKLEREVVGPVPVTVDVPAGVLMAAVAMHAESGQRLDLTEHVDNHRLTWQAPDGPWRVMLFMCVPDGAKGLVDYLDASAVNAFMSLTYDAYYEAFPEHFGTTIDGAFYDEPTFHWVEGGRAWTPGFNQRFEMKHGFSPAQLYPALWFDIGPDTAAARNALFGMRTELLAIGFIKTLADWCEAHGITMTGHVDQEEVVNPVGLCGDLIKVFEYQPIPGLDQVMHYGRGSRMYKVVSSAATNYGRRLVMSETYGATPDMPVANLYREVLDQFAKGVNMMVPHAVWYDPQGSMFMPPELSCRTEPYASSLPAYNTFVGRSQRILQHGCPVVDIAVLYPIHGLQAAYHFDGDLDAYHGGVVPDWADYMEIGERLSLELRHDFTYLHPEVFVKSCALRGDILQFQQDDLQQEYQVLILPGSNTISGDVIAKARQFFDQGGAVIATTRLPDQSVEFGRTAEILEAIQAMFGEAKPDGSAGCLMNRNAAGGRCFFVPVPTAEALSEVLAAALPVPDVAWNEPVRAEGGNLMVLHKRMDGREFYFFANSSDTAVATTVHLRGEYQLERWDPHTGAIEGQPAATAHGRTRVALRLPPVTSVFLVSISMKEGV